MDFVISSPCFLKQSGPSSELQPSIRKAKIIHPNCFHLKPSFGTVSADRQELRMAFTKNSFSNFHIFKFSNYNRIPKENSIASAFEKCVFKLVPKNTF